MSKSDKLIKKLLSKSKNFKYTELKTLLSTLNYSELKKGKTSGSRVAYMNNKTKHIIRLHKPHPQNTLKQYQVHQICDELKKQGYIK